MFLLKLINKLLYEFALNINAYNGMYIYYIYVSLYISTKTKTRTNSYT